MAGIGYRPEIDGMRAVAVIPVILFHLGWNWIPGGFLGVDVFFVISGFLITSIVKKELDLGTFSFRDFWARRIRRILPAMVAVTAVTLTVTYSLVFRPEQQAIGKQALAALLSVSNIYFWRSTGDYWSPEAEASPFLHAWSLSVEEQFYLFFPMAIWLVFRFRPRWLQGCILSVVVASLVLFLWGAQAHPTATFYLLPTRVWELGTGCLLAVTLFENRSRDAAKTNFGVFASAGLCLVLASYLFIDSLDGGGIFAVVGTTLVIAFGQAGVCNSLLSQPALVHLGKISYSLYLWHWPVLVLAKHLGLDWPGAFDDALLVVFIYVLSLGTYFLVEKPTRHRNGVVPIIVLGGVVTSIAALGMAIFPRHYDTVQFDKAKWIVYSCHPHVQNRTGGLFQNTIREYPRYDREAYAGDGIRIGDESIAPEMIVLGDSHASMWSDALATVARELNISTAFYAMGGGISPFFDIPLNAQNDTNVLNDNEKLAFDKARLRAIKEWKPKLVVIAARWDEKHARRAGDVLRLLRELNSQVLLIEDPPELMIGDRNLLQYLAWQGLLPADPRTGDVLVQPIKTLAEDEEGRRIVRELARTYDNVQVLPTYDLYQANGGALVLEGKSAVYLDDDHLTNYGAGFVVPRLREAISRIFSRSPRVTP